MKYIQTRGLQNHPLMKLTILFALLFLTAFWVTNFANYFSKMDLTPQSVRDYYLGSDELFTYDSMLGVMRVHLPIMALVTLLLTPLLLFTPYSFKVRAAFIVSGFLFALLNEASGWLVRFVSPNFAFLKVGSFLGLQGIFGYLIAASTLFMTKGKRPEHLQKAEELISDSALAAHIREIKTNGSIPLAFLRPGERGVILDVEGAGIDTPDLMEMGLTPGTRVKLVKYAPLGDPLELSVRGYHLSLRRALAKHILIEKEAKTE